ncbi:PEP-CTERM sorting domain-containing protein [Cronbergia sp. UHCC 0137]|uniref:PEP-CTERM sorting domain-containing protein n=1 Tax=Cronbergia sp. UHCC 0137 TaxID=3110239 RepID=UPI002B1F2B76|nr:PEP-CTERM sorting domain-containing protein [Cronbergia sp. UHCC 0137]MEA5617979.1 PEP-CTERM sorting domain-containing protein [Cronbergia sp. UHCC 0137]
MKIKISALIGSALLTTGVMTTLTVAPVHAATFSCASNISGKVTGTNACEVSDDFSQDSVSPNKPLTVNTEEFFDTTNWIFGGKIGSNTGYTGTKSGKSGSWNIASAIKDNWDDVMLVFKSGNDTKLTGYKVTDGVKSGTWQSPFLQFDNKGKEKSPKDVSHISVYYTTKPKPRKVPEPTALIGLGFVVSGMVFSRRRIVN